MKDEITFLQFLLRGSLFAFLTLTYFFVEPYSDDKKKLENTIKGIKKASKAFLNVTDRYSGGKKGGIPKVWGKIVNSKDTLEYVIYIYSSFLEINPLKSYYDEGKVIPIWYVPNESFVVVRISDDKKKDIELFILREESKKNTNLKLMLIAGVLFCSLLLVSKLKKSRK